MEYLINYWSELFGSKLNTQGGLYAEGGPLKLDDLHGTQKIESFHCNSNLCYTLFSCSHHVRAESHSMTKPLILMINIYYLYYFINLFVLNCFLFCYPKHIELEQEISTVQTERN